MTPIAHLVTREVAQAALIAHAEGRLTAQSNHKVCRYVDGDCNCAVGAGMPPHLIRYLINNARNWMNVLALARDHIIEVDDVAGLRSLQQSHDAWCGDHAREARFLETARRLAA
jgi:hypothetical protein